MAKKDVNRILETGEVTGEKVDQLGEFKTAANDGIVDSFIYGSKDALFIKREIKLELTDEEQDIFDKRMEDPEFVKLFHEVEGSEIIDKYINQKLSQEESVAFESRRKNDPWFDNRVNEFVSDDLVQKYFGGELTDVEQTNLLRNLRSDDYLKSCFYNELIDRKNTNNLTKEQSELFDEIMATNEGFKKSFVLQNLIIEGITAREKVKKIIENAKSNEEKENADREKRKLN